MAILNYSSTKQDILDKGYLIGVGEKDYAKLFFTGDGHIITHGVDYTKDYANGYRGLVPSTTVTGKQVFSDNGWATLTTAFLPVDDTKIAADNLWSSDKIVKYFADGLAANDAMIFKGVLNKDTDGQTTGVFANVPASGYNAGWTYRVAIAGEYAGKKCEIGDVLIAVTDAGASQTEVQSGHWTVIQTNISGTTKFTINGEVYDTYTNTVKGDMTIYAPKTSGNQGEVLISNGASAPTWVAQSTLNAGTLDGTMKSGLLTEVTAANGNISVTVGGTTKSGTAAGNWNINAASADKVNHVLKTEGDGLTSVSYDGSAEKTIRLNPATTSTLGGVIVGNNVSVDTNGTISLTKKNVVDALGYEPETVDNSVIVSNKTKGLAPQVPSTSAGTIGPKYMFLAYNPDATPDASVGIEANWYTLPSNVLGNTWRPIKINDVELFDNSNTDTNAFNLKSTGLINLTKQADNSIVISTTAEENQNAFSNVKIGATEVKANTKTDTLNLIGNNISIEGTAGTNTITFTVADFVGATATTAGQKGLTPAPAAGDNLKFLRGDGTWVVPTDTNTWREIIVGDSKLSSDITSGSLSIEAGDNIAVSLSNNTLRIASTYVPHTYGVSTGLASTTSGNATTFALKEATTSEIGGIKIAAKRSAAVTTEVLSSVTGRNYGVEIDSDGKAFVNVPWQDTNIRDIKIGGTSIGTATLNIVPSEDVVISWDKNSDQFADGEATISFGLSWYNVSTGQYETA